MHIILILFINSKFLLLTILSFSVTLENFMWRTCDISVFHKLLPFDRDSSVGIATHYVLDGSGFKHRWGQNLCSSLQVQTCCTTETGDPCRKSIVWGVILTNYMQLVPRLRMHGAIRQLWLCVCVCVCDTLGGDFNVYLLLVFYILHFYDIFHKLLLCASFWSLECRL